MHSSLHKRLKMFRLANYVYCVAACGLLTSALPASASAWKLLAKNTAAVMSADMESVVIDGTTRKVWTRYDYFSPLREQNGTDTVNVTTLHVVDCRRRMVGTEREIHRNLDTVNGEAAPLPMTKATPRSFDDVLMKAVCRA